MSNRWRKVTQGVLVFFAFSILSLPFFSGCARHPSKEELTQLDEAREAAMAAEKKLSTKKKEKAEVEAKQAAKKAELEKAKATKATTEANLASKQ